MKILIFLITLMAFSCSSETNKQRYLPMSESLSGKYSDIVRTQILDSYTGDTFILTYEGNDDNYYYYWLKVEFTPDRVKQAK